MVLTPQRDVDKAEVGKSAHSSERSRLLPTTLGTCGYKEAGIRAPEATGGPDGANIIPKGLPLGGEVAEEGWNTKYDGIVIEELTELSNRGARFRGSMHLA